MMRKMMRKMMATTMILLALLFSASMVSAKGTDYGLNVVDVTALPNWQKEELRKTLKAKASTAVVYVLLDYGEYNSNSMITWNPRDPKYSKRQFVKSVKKFKVSSKKNEDLWWALRVEPSQVDYNMLFADIAGKWYTICTKNEIDPAFMMALACTTSKFGTTKQAIRDGNIFGIKEAKKVCKGLKSPQEKEIALLKWVLKNDYWGWEQQYPHDIFRCATRVPGVVWWNTYGAMNKMFIKLRTPEIEIIGNATVKR